MLFHTQQYCLPFRVVSWNVKGINPIKRQIIISHLASYNPDLVLLQETHLTETEALKLKQSWVGLVLVSSTNTKKNGVINLCHKKLKYSVIVQDIDTDGRWILVKLLINNIF